MQLDLILLKPDNAFSQRLSEWSESRGIATESYDVRSEDYPDGMILVNSNQDCEKEDLDLHTLFDKKHIPTQKIDINGTLQVAVSNFQLWLTTNKCRSVLIVGAEELLENENLDRFLNKIKVTRS